MAKKRIISLFTKNDDKSFNTSLMASFFTVILVSFSEILGEFLNRILSIDIVVTKIIIMIIAAIAFNLLYTQGSIGITIKNKKKIVKVVKKK